jgi:hypothetical protein
MNRTSVLRDAVGVVTNHSRRWNDHTAVSGESRRRSAMALTELASNTRVHPQSAVAGAKRGRGDCKRLAPAVTKLQIDALITYGAASDCYPKCFELMEGTTLRNRRNHSYGVIAILRESRRAELQPKRGYRRGNGCCGLLLLRECKPVEHLA